MADISFIIGVSVNDEYYDNYSPLAFVTIDKNLYKKIKDSQKALNKLDACYIEYYDFSPNFMRTDKNYTDRTELNEEDLIDDEDTTHLDSLYLKVSATDIYWEGYIKHSSVVLYTDNILIETIEEAFKINSLPLEQMPLYINHENKTFRNIAKKRLK